MSRPIPLGICVSPSRVKDVAKGFDYIELGVSSDLAPLEPDADVTERLQLMRDLPYAVRAFNGFVPPQVPLAVTCL